MDKTLDKTQEAKEHKRKKRWDERAEKEGASMWTVVLNGGLQWQWLLSLKSVGCLELDVGWCGINSRQTAEGWRTTCRGLMADAEALMSKDGWQSNCLKQLSSVHPSININNYFLQWKLSEDCKKKNDIKMIVSNRALSPHPVLSLYFCYTGIRLI